MGDDKGNGIQSGLMVNGDGSLRRLGWLSSLFLCSYPQTVADDQDLTVTMASTSLALAYSNENGNN